MVYVDNFNVPFRNMIMCHMIADTKEELLEMADKIGVNRKWIQKEDTHQEHFDICKKKKELAIKYGAKEISYKQLGYICIVKEKVQELDIAVQRLKALKEPPLNYELLNTVVNI